MQINCWDRGEASREAGTTSSLRGSAEHAWSSLRLINGGRVQETCGWTIREYIYCCNYCTKHRTCVKVCESVHWPLFLPATMFFSPSCSKTILCGEEEHPLTLTRASLRRRLSADPSSMHSPVWVEPPPLPILQPTLLFDFAPFSRRALHLTGRRQQRDTGGGLTVN